jgi:hypothetical protein
VAGPRPLRAGRSRRVKRSIRGSAQGSRPWPTAPPCDFALSKSLRKPLHVKHQCARASLRGNRSFTAAAQKNGSVTTRRNNAKRRSLESHVEEQDAEVGQTSRSAAGVHAGLSPAPNPEAGPGGPARVWRPAPPAPPRLSSLWVARRAIATPCSRGSVRQSRLVARS